MSWKKFFRRRRWDRERLEEIEFHLRAETEDNLARGMPSARARAAAQRKFGNPALVREEIYHMNTLPVFDALCRDLKYASRGLRRDIGFTAIGVLTLAIGIGASTAIFSLLQGVLLKPLPYPDPDRLVRVAHGAPDIVLSDSSDVGSSEYLYFTEREENRTLEGIGLIGQGRSTVTGVGDPEVVERFFATSDVLPLLGIPPMLGRYFSEREDLRDTGGPERVVLLSYGYWQRRFGGAESVLGETLSINGEPFEIIGVMPPEFAVPNQDVDVITPYGVNRAETVVGGYFRQSIARLRAGVTLEEANADVARMIPIALRSFPPIPGAAAEETRNTRLIPVVEPLKEVVVGSAGDALWVLMGTIGIVLLMVCVNVANLVLVRTESRQQELSIRGALGAGRARILRELLTESGLLGLAGGLAGVGMAYFGLDALLRMAPAELPRLNEIGIDRTVLAFSLTVSLASACLFGLIPVLRYARPTLSALGGGSRLSGHSPEQQRARSILVAVQVALAFVLLIGAGLMIRTFAALTDVNPGFSRPDEVLTVQITIPEASVPDLEQTVRRTSEIRDRLAALPSVESVAYASAVPMGGGFRADLLFHEGKDLGDGQTPVAKQFRFVSPGLFATLEIPLVAGRDLDWTDVYDKRPVAVVSEDIAGTEWGSPEAALGRRLRGSSPEDQWREIVGVVGEVRDRGLGFPVLETVYVPVLAEGIFNSPIQAPRSVTYAIRSSLTGTPTLPDEVRGAVWSVDSNLPLVNIRTMGDLVRNSIAPVSFTLVLLGISGIVALILGVVGVYGVIAYAVSRRQREIGIRMALGARPGLVRNSFVRHGLLLTVIGSAVGLGLALTLTHLMRALLFGVSPLDPATFVTVGIILAVATVLASFLPANRAARVDPVEALRLE